MDSLERNIALALMLGRLEAALAVVQGLEHRVFGVSEEDRQALEMPPEIVRCFHAKAARRPQWSITFAMPSSVT